MTQQVTPDGGPAAPRWRDVPEVRLGLGTNTFGRVTDEERSFRVLDAFAEAGGTLVDTADTYSGGEAEEMLGRWLRSRGARDRTVVVTKVGNRADLDGLAASTVTQAIEGCLRRLGTDHLDVVLAHYEDPTVPAEESAAAFDAAYRAGTVRAVGLSNFSGAAVREWVDLARAGDLAVPLVLQPHYSLVHRTDYETAIAPVAAAERIAVLPYRALAGGFLTGKYRDLADTEGRPRGPGVVPHLTPEGLGLLDVVEAVAADHGVRPAAVAIAWLLRRPTVTAPLASVTSVEQLHELLAATRVELSDEEVARLDTASDGLG